MVINDAKAAPKLLENLIGDPCFEVKIAAVQALSKMQFQEVVPWLKRLLVRHDEEINWDEEEFYHADLIGLAVELTDGTAFGEVKAVHDFGAGDLLEIVPKASAGGSRETIMLPFNGDAVPEIDLVNGRMVITDPMADGDDDGGDGGGGDVGRGK